MPPSLPVGSKTDDMGADLFAWEAQRAAEALKAEATLAAVRAEEAS